MRLWHYKLIPYLPKPMLVSQWRECIAIKRQWEKGTLKHRLVSYVMNYDKVYFGTYVQHVISELHKRKIKYNDSLYCEICVFSGISYAIIEQSKIYYPEHNDRYLKQCLYNLQEKADRGIVSKEEWDEIEKDFYEYLEE